MSPGTYILSQDPAQLAMSIISKRLWAQSYKGYLQSFVFT